MSCFFLKQESNVMPKKPWGWELLKAIEKITIGKFQCSPILMKDETLSKWLYIHIEWNDVWTSYWLKIQTGLFYIDVDSDYISISG